MWDWVGGGVAVAAGWTAVAIVGAAGWARFYDRVGRDHARLDAAADAPDARDTERRLGSSAPQSASGPRRVA